MTAGAVKQTEPFLQLPKALVADRRPIQHDKNPAKPLNRDDKWVWCVIKWWDWGDERPWNPTYELLADMAQMSERQAKKSVKRLEIAGWLRVVRRRGEVNQWEALTDRPDEVDHPQVTKRDAIEKTLVRRGAPRAPLANEGGAPHAPVQDVHPGGAPDDPGGGAPHAPTVENQPREPVGEETSLSGPAARDQDQEDTSTASTPTEKAKATIAKIDADPDRRVAIELTTYMRRKLREHDVGVPDRGTLTSLRWVADMDLLLRRGAPDTEPAPVAADDVRAVIDYVVADGFWRGNVRCPDKLRRQWEQLRHKARRARSPFADRDGGDGPAEGTAEWWAAYRARGDAGEVVDAEVVDVQRTA